MSWLEVLAHWLREFFPLCFIRPNERGVRYVMLPGCGVRVQEVGPGARLRLLGIAEIEVTNVAADLLEIEPQDLTSADGKPVHLRVAVRMRVTDPVKYQLAVKHTDTSLSNRCEVEVARLVREHTRAAIRRNLTAFEVQLLAAIGPKAAEWGVEVSECGLTRHTEAPPYRLILEHGQGLL